MKTLIFVSAFLLVFSSCSKTLPAPYPDPNTDYYPDPYNDPSDPYYDPGDPYYDPSDPGDPYSDPGDPYSDPGDPYSDPGDGGDWGSSGKHAVHHGKATTINPGQHGTSAK